MLTVKKVSPLGLLIIAIVVVEVLIFMPSSIKDVKKEAFEAPAPDVNLSIEGFKAVNLNAEGQKETIRAKQAEMYQEKGYAILKEVDVKIFSRGDHVIRIQGKQGKYDLNQKNIEFFGDIVAVSENLGYQLKTQTLKYVEASKLLSTDDKVWISGPNPLAPSLEVEGTGLRAHTQREEFSLLNQVHCKKFDEGAQSIDIQSDQADIFIDKSQALFKDNVVVTQRDMNIFSDRFLITYNRNNKSIDEARAFQKVKIVQADRIASCQNAHFLNKEQKIILTGEPKVLQGADTIQAKKVIFFTAENKILFDEAVGEVRDVELKGLEGVHK